jgi:hypothetical protein
MLADNHLSPSEPSCKMTEPSHPTDKDPIERTPIMGVIAEDVLKDMPIGASLHVQPVPVGGMTGVGAIPGGVTNWTYFEGALLAIVISSQKETSVAGSAVMIAPGLAITATHVLSDVLHAIMSSSAEPLCIGPTSAGLTIWRLKKINFQDRNDIAYLSLELASAISPDWRIRTLPITTRTPAIGAAVSLVGFRLPAVETTPTGEFMYSGDLYAAVGQVTAVYHPLRDRTLMPYPTIEVACGSLKGMSGGAVLDSNGHLIGVTSRGMETIDHVGPSNASWIIGGLDRSLEITWPPGLYPDSIHLLDIDQRLLRIEGRDRVKVSPGQPLEYRVWY